jgi:hypothetical protein
MKRSSKQFHGLFGIIVICLLMITPLIISCGSAGDGVTSAQNITQQNEDTIGSNGSESSSGGDPQSVSSDVTEQIIATYGVDDAPSILPAPAAEYSHVRVQRDFRKCASPFCGGFFISALNKRTLRCIDGSQSESCYVAEIDWSKTSLSSSQIKELENATSTGQVIVLGQIRPLVDFKLDNPGVLAAGRAWLAATDAEPKGHFFRVEDLGIRCFTTPCFSMRAFLLNINKSVDISDLDLSDVDAKDDQIKEAWKALTNGRLLVAGKLSSTAAERKGRVLTASQFYLPVAPLECKVDNDCTASVYIAPVDGPEDCYCQTCPVPISVNEAMSNEKQWREYCQDVRLICPLYPCVMPRPVGCVNNKCEYMP